MRVRCWSEYDEKLCTSVSYFSKEYAEDPVIRKIFPLFPAGSYNSRAPVTLP